MYSEYNYQYAIALACSRRFSFCHFASFRRMFRTALRHDILGV